MTFDDAKLKKKSETDKKNFVIRTKMCNFAEKFKRRTEASHMGQNAMTLHYGEAERRQTDI